MVVKRLLPLLALLLAGCSGITTQFWNSFWLDTYWWGKRILWYIEGKGPQPP